MARYFFDIAKNGGDFPDDEGTELRDLQEVRKDAVTTLLEIAQSYASRGSDISMATFVRDETGIVIARVSLAVKVES